MKKIFSLLVGALMLIGLNSCEKKVEINEANIMGKWELTTITTGDQEVTGGGQIWELAEGHQLYVYLDGEKTEAGEWRLDGTQLTTRFFPFPATVSKLTEKNLVLELKEPNSGMVAVKYEFAKVK